MITVSVDLMHLGLTITKSRHFSAAFKGKKRPLAEVIEIKKGAIQFSRKSKVNFHVVTGEYVNNHDPARFSHYRPDWRMRR